MIDGAEQKLVRLHQAKSDVDDKMAVVHQTLQEVRQIIQNNLHNKDNLDGVMTRKEPQYMACLELKHRELEDLFRQDEHHLAENIELSKRRAAEIKTEIEALMERQR